MRVPFSPIGFRQAIIVLCWLVIACWPAVSSEFRGFGSSGEVDSRSWDSTLRNAPVQDSSLGRSDSTGSSDTESLALKPNHRKVDNLAFGVKERLDFSVDYGFINAGSASLEIDTIINVRGQDCFRIMSTAKSNAFFSKFYRVNDWVASYVDTLGLYPLWFEKHLREGSFKADVWVRFDQPRNLAVESSGDTTIVPPFVQDVLSAMYYVRTLPLEVGKSLYVDNYADRKNYPLEVRVLRREKKKVDAGEFDCFVVEPLLQEGSGIFANRGRLTVWLSADQYRLPIYMRSKVIFIGSISAQLKSFRRGETRASR